MPVPVWISFRSPGLASLGTAVARPCPPSRIQAHVRALPCGLYRSDMLGTHRGCLLLGSHGSVGQPRKEEMDLSNAYIGLD